MSERNRGFWLAFAAACVALMSAAIPANAQSVRTFVSGLGTDSGGCGRTAPCRSFAYAITQTQSGGEIVVLDSAGYGPITIAQSLTITNPGGVEAGITATSGGNAITINPTAAINVILRGLTLSGTGGGVTGIDYAPVPPLQATSGPYGGTLSIIDCVVTGFSGNGIAIAPVIGSGSGSFPEVSVLITKTLSLQNGTGLSISPNSVYVIASIDQSTFSANGTGVSLSYTNGGFAGIEKLAFFQSHADRNQSNGVALVQGAALTMKNSTAQYNVSLDVENTASQEAAANALYLYNNNTIGSLTTQSGSTAYSDGTNNIGTLTGTLTRQLMQ